MIPDVWGLADHTRDLATRLCGEGFTVMAMDPYRKVGQPSISDPSSAMAFIRELSDPVVLETVQECIDAVTAEVAGERVGIMGFCMGGQYALLAGCRCTGLSACAPFYGMLRYEEGLDASRKPASPLEALGELSCPVLGLYGEQDAIIPVADVEALRTGLATSGHQSEVVLYPDAGHAFMNDTRPQLFCAEAAADAWARLVAFLKARL